MLFLCLVFFRALTKNVFLTFIMMTENDFAQQAAQFSDKQLLRIVYEFAEWDEEMQTAVQHELSMRNLLPDDVAARKAQVIERDDAILSEGKAATFPQMFLGWIGILGLLGLIIGYQLAFAKVTSVYTGKEYFKYDDDSRENGKFMFYITITLAGLWILYKLTRYI
jgi:hypothetical protein